MFVQHSFALYPNLNRHHFVPPFQFNHDFSSFKRRISVQSSFASTPNPNQDFAQNASTEIIPRRTNFLQTIWGDHFITYVPRHITYDACREHIEEMKEIRRMLATDPSEPSKKIRLIDSLQQLGVAYHFQVEIEKVLEQIYDGPNYGFDDNDDIYSVALQFRLLRQQGYNVPCGKPFLNLTTVFVSVVLRILLSFGQHLSGEADIFNKFKNSDGNFKEDLINDVSGMLCLYEATHLSVHGEDILDEALKFTTTRLKSLLPDLKPPLSTQVMHALRQALHKGMARVEAKHYISVYQEGKTKNESLLKFAKLDYNLLQSMYQQELSQLSRWWKELGLLSKIRYSRDRHVECYLFALGMCFEPRYALARMFYAKFSILITIIDDTYDTYGTFEEVQLFTDAIERWDVSAIDGLPEYMKELYSVLLDVYNEITEELTKERRSYCANYVKEALKILFKSYFIEAKWYDDGYIPTFGEYMQNAIITSTVTTLSIIYLVCMGDTVTKEALDWIIDMPKLVKATSIFGRLTDDVIPNKDEQETDKFIHAVGCYMKQYHVSEQEAYDELMDIIKNKWKDINQECIKPTAFPMPVLLLFVNFARFGDVLYKDHDGFNHAHEETKDVCTSLFVDPICM